MVQSVCMCVCVPNIFWANTEHNASQRKISIPFPIDAFERHFHRENIGCENAYEPMLAQRYSLAGIIFPLSSTPFRPLCTARKSSGRHVIGIILSVKKETIQLIKN